MTEITKGEATKENDNATCLRSGTHPRALIVHFQPTLGQVIDFAESLTQVAVSELRLDRGSDRAFLLPIESFDRIFFHADFHGWLLLRSVSHITHHA